MTKKQIFLDNACHLCDKRRFADKRTMRRHLKSTHGLSLPSAASRQTAVAPSDSVFVLRFEDADAIAFNCPSCIRHFNTLDEVKDHVNDEHLQAPKSQVTDGQRSDVEGAFDGQVSDIAEGSSSVFMSSGSSASSVGKVRKFTCLFGVVVMSRVAWTLLKTALKRLTDWFFFSGTRHIGLEVPNWTRPLRCGRLRYLVRLLSVSMCGERHASAS